MYESKQYPISEYFESIQGEGNYAGVNSLFIRFQYCNLKCVWCDTKYTWTKHDGRFELFSEEMLIGLIKDSRKHHIILTGGEPAIQPLDRLYVPDKKLHVETNGTIIPTQELTIELSDKTIHERPPMDEEIIKDYNWVVSPKLSNSKQDINEEALDYWAKCEYAVFKFIVRNATDIDEINKVVSQYQINKTKVYLGMEGARLKTQLNKALLDEIIVSNYNFSPRLHVLFWEGERAK